MLFSIGQRRRAAVSQGENKDRVGIGKTHKDRLQLTTDRVQRIELN